MERLMTIDEVADYLRVPVLTVRWLRQDGPLRAGHQGRSPAGVGGVGDHRLGGGEPRADGMRCLSSAT